MLDEIIAEGAKSRPREGENFTAMEIDVDTEACTADIKLFGDMELSGRDALVTFSFYRSDGSVMLSWFGILDDDLAAVSNERVRMMHESLESEGQ